MALNMASKLGDVLADERFPEDRKVLVRETLAGHGLSEDITAHEACLHVAFITRPELLLAFDVVLEPVNG